MCLCRSAYYIFLYRYNKNKQLWARHNLSPCPLLFSSQENLPTAALKTVLLLKIFSVPGEPGRQIAHTSAPRRESNSRSAVPIAPVGPVTITFFSSIACLPPGRVRTNRKKSTFHILFQLFCRQKRIHIFQGR